MGFGMGDSPSLTWSATASVAAPAVHPERRLGPGGLPISWLARMPNADDRTDMNPRPMAGPLAQPRRSWLSSLARAPFAQRRMRRRGRFDEMAQLAGAVDRAVQARGDRAGAPRVLVVQLKI